MIGIKTIRRMLYLDFYRSIALVSLVFLGLFLFFDFLEELGDVGEQALGAYSTADALLYVVLLIPGRLYELFPIAVLIGCVFVLARLAQSQEFTILRTSGLGPWRALAMMLVFGFFAAVLAFVIGDYVSPLSQKTAALMKASSTGDTRVAGESSAWVKGKSNGKNVTANIATYSLSEERMEGVRIYELDGRSRLSAIYRATSARFTSLGWQLIEVSYTQFNYGEDSQGQIRQLDTRQTKADLLEWPTNITRDMVTGAIVRPERMNTTELYSYTQHLKQNAQSSQLYEIAFWRKVFYPLSALVMVVLALPFAYLHFRSGNIAAYVFVGVLIGISFFLLNNIFGYLGYLNHWTPWLASAAPSIIYSLLSLTAFGWLVLRR